METLHKLDQYDDAIGLKLAIEQVNQWYSAGKHSTAWQLDPIVLEMPNSWKALPSLSDPEQVTFDPSYDGEFLREAVWLGMISKLIAETAPPEPIGIRAPPAERKTTPLLSMTNASDPPELQLAERIFDWTIRNIQLEAPEWTESAPLELPRNWHSPWETVLLGRGTASDRAWLFMLLARQQGLNVVMLSLGDPAKPDELVDWIPALLLSSGEGDNKRTEFYLFDPALGLPIPAPRVVDGKPTDALQIATLSQVVADEKLLRQLDAGGKKYPVTADDLKSVTVRVEASPGYLSKRMKVLESQLAGSNRVILSSSPTELEKSLPAAEYLSKKVGVWPRPYETLTLRAAADADTVKRFEQQMLAYNNPLLKKELVEGDKNDRITRHREDPESGGQSRRQTRQRHPLRVGRMMQVIGRNDQDQGAIRYLQEAQVSEAEQAELAARVPIELLRALSGSNHAATFWLGQVKAAEGAKAAHDATDSQQQGNQAAADEQRKIAERETTAALNYFDKFEHNLWRGAATYNLGRLYEVLGNNTKAIEVYRLDESPQRQGNLLRARQLERLK
ncbi:MAG: hypothetical protein SGJ20_01185 [Planctomycetota bacterium]|nr:hypothetical protein [Planctomycetota bacterium]